jgi:hypothetical protein
MGSGISYRIDRPIARHNAITDDGAASIAKALKVNTVITYVNLNSESCMRVCMCVRVENCTRGRVFTSCVTVDNKRIGSSGLAAMGEREYHVLGCPLCVEGCAWLGLLHLQSLVVQGFSSAHQQLLILSLTNRDLNGAV